MGRPTIYSPELATQVLARIAEGESLRSICRDEEMPCITTVMKWAREDTDGFTQHYVRARDDRADAKFEELDAVSEDAVAAESAVTVAGLRLKADNIKWQLARMNAKKYGDRVETHHSGEVAVKRIERVITRNPQD